MTVANSKDQETLDTLLDGRVRLFQPESGYRVAIDPVLLAAAVDVRNGARILDVGCGTGAALFCVLTRLDKSQGIGLERQSTLAALARRGIEANGLAERVQIQERDLASPASEMGASFDAVMTNPPYFEAGSVRSAPEDERAHTESTLTLSQWIDACFKYLKSEGFFAIIHRAERLADIIATVNGHAGEVKVIPLWPKAGQPAKRVIVTAKKGRKSPSMIHPGLVLHQENGDFTAEAETILRNAAPLVTSA